MLLKNSTILEERIDEVFEKKQNRSSEERKVMLKLRFAFQNNMFDSVKKIFDVLVWNDRNGRSSRDFLVDEEGNSPLFWACSVGNYNLVMMLVEKYKFSINDQNYEGCTALVVSILGEYNNIVGYLLEKGANPNICNLKREIPLHIACCLNLSKVCEALLIHGSWIEPEDESGETPLHWAVREDFLEVAEILLKYGANPDHKNEDNETPRDMSNLSISDALVLLLDSFAGTESYTEIDSEVPINDNCQSLSVKIKCQTNICK